MKIKILSFVGGVLAGILYESWWEKVDLKKEIRKELVLLALDSLD